MQLNFRFSIGFILSLGLCLSGSAANGPMRSAPEPVAFDQIQVQGETGVRLACNFDRLEEEKYQPDHVFLTLKESGDWPGDTEGRTILGLALAAQATHRLPKYLEEILRRLPAKVNEKGYFGNILAADTVDEQQLSSHGWVLRGLCEYYLWQHDVRCLEWINRIVDNLVLPTKGFHRQYPIDPEQRAKGGGVSGNLSRQIGPWLVSTDVGCDFIFLDGVVQAYAVTHREELKPVIDEMIGRFLEVDLRGIKAQTHASLTAMRALLRYYEITGDAKLLKAVRERFALYRQYGMTENYENYNWFGRPEWTEPCAVVDSYQVAVGLWRWTGEADYMELAERIYYNGLAFAQRANGGFGTQKCSGAGTPLVAVDCQEAHWCCTMRGAEGLARAAQSSFFTDAKGLYVTRFNNATVKASFGGRGVLELREETGYPFAGKVQLTVLSNTLSFAPAIRLFAPKWISKPVITLNGQRVKARLENGFACIAEPLRAGDVIAYDFQIGSGALPVEGRASTPGWRKLYYGPLLLATEPGTDTALPESPQVQMQPDHTFWVNGMETVFGTVYHLLDARVKSEPRYQVQMLFKGEADTSPKPPPAATAETAWSAQWIGLPEAGGTNAWLCYRKQTVLNAVPKSLPVRLACDSKYWLWVNGELVVFEGQLKRGPTPRDTYYDEFDLAPHLRQGENTIAVLLWYWGKHGFSHNSSGQAGLIFDAGKFLHSDKSWKVIRHPAFGNTDKPHPNFRLSESNIQFDARQDIGLWMSSAFDDRAWSPAVEFGQPPVGPWGKLVRRPIPQWKDSGLREYQNATALPQESDGGDVVAQLPYNAHVTPYLKVEAPAGLVIDIRTDNYIVTGLPTVRAVYITRAGVQEYESLGWMNGHQVRYSIPKGVKILELKYRETGYAADFAGRFDCDDAALNQLWEEARRTLYVNMRDTYMDCPDRERAQWWGDAVNQQGEAFYVFDSARGPLLAKKAILELARWQRSDGSLYSPVPAGGPSDTFPEITTPQVEDGTWNRELPLQILASVGWYGFWNYYVYTGDRQTIAEVYPAVRSYLALWKLGADGLAVHRAGQWDWPDWGNNADVAVLDNTWLYLALKGAVEMARLTGNTADVAGYEEKMKAIATAFNRTFWKGDHYHSPAHSGDTDDRANAMAVVAGLAKPEQYPAICRVLAAKTYASPYMEKYVLEALFLMGAPEQGLTRMKSRYAAMLHDHSTTLWENFGDGKDCPGSGTYNHAWSGGPLTILSQYAAGLAPTTPGWKTFNVRPQLGTLNTVAASVSAPSGDIRVTMQRGEKQFRIELDSPADTRPTVCLPKPASGDWQRIRVNDAVVWDGQKAIHPAITKARHISAEPKFHRLEVSTGHCTILAD